MTGMANGEKTTRQGSIEADKSEPNREMRLVAVYPGRTYQTIHGFGGAFTEAAGYVYSLMDAADRAEVVRTYFGPGDMGYTWGRASIDSSDFGLEMYAAGDDPADAALERMDFSRGERYVLPLIRDAEAVAGGPLQMMLTPWTPPAWMKTNGSRVGGGHLREACAPIWAEMICRHVERFIELGLDVRLLSTQNEPHAAQLWDSCLMDDGQERAFIRDHLAPALKRHGLNERLALLVWDHNKEHLYDRAEAILGDGALDGMVGGAAFHWYSGDHFEAVRMTRERFPDKRLVFSEGCVEHSVWGTEAEQLGAVKYAHEYIGDINAGADTLIDWNLLLDEKGGPNHAGNFCDAPMMYDTVNHQLHKKLSLDYIGHFSRFIKPGAVRLGVSAFSPEIEATAAKNPNGSVAAVLLNTAEEERRFWLRLDGRFYPILLPAFAIATCVAD